MKEQSTTKGFAILSAAGMVTKVMSLLYIPFLLRIIGDVGYGIYGATYQIYTFVFVITNSGIPVAISKLISEMNAVGDYKNSVKSFKIARFMLIVLGIMMMLFLILLSMPLAKFIKFPRAYLSLVSLAPAILFTSVSSAYRGYFQGNGNMTPTAVSQVIEQGLNIVFSIVFAAILMKYGIEAGCAGGTIGTSLGALFSACFLMFCYNNYSLNTRYQNVEQKTARISTKQIVKKIINYGVPITLCVGMTYAGNIIDVYNTKARLMVGGFNENTATALYGILTKYQQLLNVPITIISSLAMAILPAISAASVVNDKVEVENRINYSFRLCFLIAVPATVGFAILSQPIFYLLKFGDGARIMTFGSVVLVLMAVMQIQTTILQGIGKLYVVAVYSVIGIAFKIAVNYVLIANPKINILGAVVGTIFGYSIPILLNYRKINKSLNVRIDVVIHAVKPVISSIAMGACVFLTYYLLNILTSFISPGYVSNAISTIGAIVVGMFTYAFVMASIGGITAEDMGSLPTALRKIMPKFILSRIK